MSNFLKLKGDKAFEGKGLVLIDDSGLELNVDGALQKRTTWVAVLVPPSESERASSYMDGLNDEVERLFGSREIHCYDIFQRKRRWKDKPIDHLKQVILVLSVIFQQENFPVVV